MQTESLQAVAPESPRAAFNAALQEALQADLLKLFESEQPDGCRFRALINVGQCPSDTIAALVAKHGLDYEPLFLTMPEAHSAQTGPWLITLPEQPSRALIADLARDAAVHQAMSLLCSPLPGFQLHQHLRAYMNCEMLNGKSGLLRYFDPRVGFEIYKTWPEEIQQQFMLPFSCWASWDRAFEPLQIRGKQLRHTTTPLAFALVLNQALMDYLDSINECDLLIGKLCEDHKNKRKAVTGLEDTAPLLQYEIAKQALAFADTQKIYSSAERQLFVRYALTVHPTFYNSPQFQEALEKNPSIIDRFVNALNVLRHDIADFWRIGRNDFLAGLYQHFTEQLRSRHAGSPGNPYRQEQP